MHYLLGRLRPLLPALLALGLLAGAECAAREALLRVAVPHSYEAQLEKQPAGAVRCEAPNYGCVRYRYSLGSDYQILEWLQNGKVDGAVVSGMTLELLRRAMGDDRKFEREFLVGERLPLNDLAPRRYRVALRGEKEGVSLPDAEGELARLFEALHAGNPRTDAVVELPSHLSAAAPELHRRVRAWTRERLRDGADDRHPSGALANGLVPRLRFATGGAAGAPLRLILEEREGGPLADVFLVRRLALPEPLDEKANAMPPLQAEKAFLDYLADASKPDAPEGELRRFAAANYVNESAGWRNRLRFAFTLDELRGILRSHGQRDTAEDDGIALVLTGGGVKAAYQTKLIDHLYGDGFLRNRFASGEADPAAVPVKFVVGTSGGALLGIFVASLDDTTRSPDLSTKIWYRHKDGKPVALLSSDVVFPPVDLMRWLSLVWCMAIFTAVCAVASMYLRRMRGYAPADACDHGVRFWRTSLWWMLLLAGTPWLLVYMNGRHGTEHVPAIQGAFYFGYLLVAIYSDNRLVVGAERRDGKSAWPPVALGLCGLALLALALADRANFHVLHPLGDYTITRAALIACFGVACVFLALHWWFVRCARRLQPIPRQALPAFALLVLVCALAYALLFAAAWRGYVSLFELNLGFWAVLGAMALAVSIALVVLAFGLRVPLLRRRFDFLLAPHPSRCADRSHWVSTGRYSRMVLGFTLGWAWWNVAVAPGLYGNNDAQRYFEDAARNVFDAGKPAGARSAVGPDRTLDVTFRAFYAAPVTALEKGVERYVIFQPPQFYAPDADDTPLGGYRSWLSISNDPRWLTIDSEQKQSALVMRVAFASGSPFPVFPAHRIDLPRVGEELLVDGGYAHNVPVEAGKRLGARRVLVINSSPREAASRAGEADARFQYVGNLTWMVRWIVPYLYERSQVEDALSAEDLIVGLIAPSASAQGWPFLTDFRAEVIERLFKEAEQDRGLRVGSIENWGRPGFFSRRPAGPFAP